MGEHRDAESRSEVPDQYVMKEYWAISPNDCSVELYALEQGQYRLRQIYSLYRDNLLNKISAEERKLLTAALFPLILSEATIPLAKLLDKFHPPVK